MSDEKKGGGDASVLILGGTGFIGRNLVKFLVDNQLARKIRVADKSQPMTSYLSTNHKAAFEQKDVVEFRQCDLSKDDHVKRAFADAKFDYVVNLCGETRFGMSEADYKLKCVQTAEKSAAAAKEHGVKKFVEVSTAQVYQPTKTPSDEKDKLEPWTELAKHRLMAEEVVKKVAGLPSVVLRPAYVWGEGDLTSITPRLTCAAVYRDAKEKMKFLWDKSLLLNVVHVGDVCRAIWLACEHIKAGSVYNLSDTAALDQGMLNDVLGKIFDIETGFHGSLISNLAKMNLSATAESVNDKHVPVWQKLCIKHNILNTPLSPFMDKELLKQNHLSVDGTAITKDYKFTYEQNFTVDAVRELILLLQVDKHFPPILQDSK